MKLNAVTFNEDETPATLTVTMTVDEAALIYAFVGHVVPVDIINATNSRRWSDANHEVATCLSGSFFNRFYENGASEVAPTLHPSVGPRDKP